MKRKDRKDRSSDVLPLLAEPERKVPRRLRVEGELFEHLAVAVLELEDPRLGSIGVTRVRMTDDLRLVTVYVHATGLGAEPTEQRQREILRGLSSAKNRLRKGLGENLDLRFVPELRFHYDAGVDHARRIEELLSEIHRDQG